ncbi:hypothetical protein OIU76_009584 [Salix suchowensis]|nr:hypothetical protein OIU76_009584 [Salix suchowensis]
MTTGNIASKKERKSRRNKPVDENAPLLPKRQEDVGFDEFNGASFTGAVFNLSTTIVGAGIMALPAIMKVLGLVLGVALIIFMAFLTEASIEMLLRFSRVGKSASYGGLMGDAFGKTGRIMLQVAVLINKIGAPLLYSPRNTAIVLNLVVGFSIRLSWRPDNKTHVSPSFHIMESQLNFS